MSMVLKLPEYDDPPSDLRDHAHPYLGKHIKITLCSVLLYFCDVQYNQ